MEISEAEFQRRLETAKLAALAEFAAGAGHEINNPLATISGRAQLLLRDETDPERRQALATIGGQALRIRDMIGDLMLFARPPQPNPEPLDLAEAVPAVLEPLRERAAAHGCTFEVRIAGPVPILADRIQLAVALSSLVQNSIDALGTADTAPNTLSPPSQRGANEFSPPLQGGAGGGKAETSDSPYPPRPPLMKGGGQEEAEGGSREGERADRTVTVAARPATEQGRPVALLSVTDRGPGLSELDRAHLFDPFYSGRPAGRGLGFGLSKCWRIVTMHGGRIEVESTPHQTTTFTLCWPALECGGLSPLSIFAEADPDFASNKSKSGDRSPHSKAEPFKPQ